VRAYEDDHLPRGWWKIVLIAIAVFIAFIAVVSFLWACVATLLGRSLTCKVKRDRARVGGKGVMRRNEIEPRF
jgi:hypothetical protein